MATLNSVLANIEQYIGFPTSRTKQVNRRLAEADITPTGGPRRSPQLDVQDFLALLAASAMENGLGDVVASHRSLRAMTPGGLPPTADVPSHLTETAWERLRILAELALCDLESQRLAAATNIEFVSAPIAEVNFRDRDSVVTAFHETGHSRGAWAAGHRRSTTISGGAFVSAVRSLFS